MKIVYFGTAPFAVPALEAVANHCLAVVSQPAKPTGRGLQTTQSPVAKTAERLGIPVLTPEKARDPLFVEHLASLEADLFVVAAYGQILRKSVLSLPSVGCFNLHGSLLPRWRGAAPVQRAIEAGDTLSGVSLMKMDEGMDTGPIVAMERMVIGPDETAGELMTRLSELAGSMIGHWAPMLARGEFTLTAQEDEQATHAAKIRKEDGIVRPGMEAKKAYDLYRAFSPAPGAWIQTPNGLIRITQTQIREEPGPAGTILATRPELVVSLKDGSLALLEVQPEGRRRMSGADYANGARLAVGQRWILPEDEPEI